MKLLNADPAQSDNIITINWGAISAYRKTFTEGRAMKMAITAGKPLLLF